MFNPNDQDDPAMDNEHALGSWITIESGSAGALIIIGSSRTPYDYIIKTVEGATIQICSEEIVEVSDAKMNPTEGIEGYHNSIGGYSCPACHDQGGCSQCSDTWMN